MNAISQKRIKISQKSVKIENSQTKKNVVKIFFEASNCVWGTLRVSSCKRNDGISHRFYKNLIISQKCVKISQKRVKIESSLTKKMW